MNRTEAAIGEGIGILIASTLRLTLELLVFVVIPFLVSATVALLLLHAWLTNRVMEAFDLPDSILIRILIGAALLPVMIAVAGAALLVLGLAAYFVAIADLHLLIKVLLMLTSLGAALSAIAIGKDLIADGADAELQLDFTGLWEE